jgi:hypothetical protein
MAYFMAGFGILAALAIAFACLRPPARFKDSNPKPMLAMITFLVVLAIFGAASFAIAKPTTLVSATFNQAGIEFRFILPERTEPVQWSEMTSAKIEQNRLKVVTRNGKIYISPVIYSPDQEKHQEILAKNIQSIRN